MPQQTRPVISAAASGVPEPMNGSAKAVERTAEAIGADIAAGEQREIQRALQLSLPIIAAQPIPILCVEMDGTGVPVAKA